MKHIKTVLPLVLVALLVSSCARKPDAEGFKKAIDDMNAESIASMESGSSDKVLAFYAEDAISMPPNMEPLKGKAAIAAWMKQMNESGMKVTSCSFATSDHALDGTVGYVYGTYDMSVQVPGMGEMSDKGSYLTVWVQEKEGAWKVKAETWASSNPPVPMGQK